MNEKIKKLGDLKSEMKVYKTLLQNYSLKNELIPDFLEYFGLREESEIIPYILDLNNGYELAKYGYRNDKIPAYNGKGYRKGYRTTLGASHSHTVR